MSEIRHGDYILEVAHLSESNYYRLVNAAGPGRATILELQIFDDGYCVDFIEARRALDKELGPLEDFNRGLCGTD